VYYTLHVLKAKASLLLADTQSHEIIQAMLSQSINNREKYQEKMKQEKQ